jgi:hypothetical protein
MKTPNLSEVELAEATVEAALGLQPGTVAARRNVVELARAQADAAERAGLLALATDKPEGSQAFVPVSDSVLAAVAKLTGTKLEDLHKTIAGHMPPVSIAAPQIVGKPVELSIRERHIIVLGVQLDTSGRKPTAPTEIRIFPKGEISTKKGTFIYDSIAERIVKKLSKDWGNEHHFDYEHAALLGGPSPAAGWYRLDSREDGLYAVNIRWTERAEKFLTSKEYKYLSPAFIVDKDKRIVELLNVALTNLPATNNAQPIMMGVGLEDVVQP